ncbi:hypothetical protein EVG20_g6500 [Dentipellis fragilis]|uniref:Transmembrane protein n=1 Tax=Dentipellis fragilis TaxID=205917 RepID=A0A4Y9YKR9_9AGAM|nr:hypothetical protein EVG20_g6500 [Dentipellis fragilis]
MLASGRRVALRLSVVPSPHNTPCDTATALPPALSMIPLISAAALAVISLIFPLFVRTGFKFFNFKLDFLLSPLRSFYGPTNLAKAGHVLVFEPSVETVVQALIPETVPRSLYTSLSPYCDSSFKPESMCAFYPTFLSPTFPTDIDFPPVNIGNMQSIMDALWSHLVLQMAVLIVLVGLAVVVLVMVMSDVPPALLMDRSMTALAIYRQHGINWVSMALLPDIVAGLIKSRGQPSELPMYMDARNDPHRLRSTLAWLSEIIPPGLMNNRQRLVLPPVSQTKLLEQRTLEPPPSFRKATDNTAPIEKAVDSSSSSNSDAEPIESNSCLVDDPPLPAIPTLVSSDSHESYTSAPSSPMDSEATSTPRAPSASSFEATLLALSNALVVARRYRAESQSRSSGDDDVSKSLNDVLPTLIPLGDAGVEEVAINDLRLEASCSQVATLAAELELDYDNNLSKVSPVQGPESQASSALLQYEEPPLAPSGSMNGRLTMNLMANSPGRGRAPTFIIPSSSSRELYSRSGKSWSVSDFGQLDEPRVVLPRQHTETVQVSGSLSRVPPAVSIRSLKSTREVVVEQPEENECVAPEVASSPTIHEESPVMPVTPSRPSSPVVAPVVSTGPTTPEQELSQRRLYLLRGRFASEGLRNRTYTRFSTDAGRSALALDPARLQPLSYSVPHSSARAEELEKHAISCLGPADFSHHASIPAARQMEADEKPQGRVASHSEMVDVSGVTASPSPCPKQLENPTASGSIVFDLVARLSQLVPSPSCHETEARTTSLAAAENVSSLDATTFSQPSLPAPSVELACTVRDTHVSSTLKATALAPSRLKEETSAPDAVRGVSVPAATNVPQTSSPAPQAKVGSPKTTGAGSPREEVGSPNRGSKRKEPDAFTGWSFSPAMSLKDLASAAVIPEAPKAEIQSDGNKIPEASAEGGPISSNVASAAAEESQTPIAERKYRPPPMRPGMEHLRAGSESPFSPASSSSQPATPRTPTFNFRRPSDGPWRTPSFASPVKPDDNADGSPRIHVFSATEDSSTPPSGGNAKRYQLRPIDRSLKTSGLRPSSGLRPRHSMGEERRATLVHVDDDTTKRRRVRTCSAQNVGADVSVSAPAHQVDKSGQIVLPAGTGWRGRSFGRQRQPTALSPVVTKVDVNADK